MHRRSAQRGRCCRPDPGFDTGCGYHGPLLCQRRLQLVVNVAHLILILCKVQHVEGRGSVVSDVQPCRGNPAVKNVEFSHSAAHNRVLKLTPVTKPAQACLFHGSGVVLSWSKVGIACTLYCTCQPHKAASRITDTVDHLPPCVGAPGPGVLPNWPLKSHASRPF